MGRLARSGRHFRNRPGRRPQHMTPYKRVIYPCVFRSVFSGGYSIKLIFKTSIFAYLAGLAFRFRLASGFYIQPLKRIPGFVVYGDFI